MRIIIKTYSKKWYVNKEDFNVFNDINIDENEEIFINIKDNIFSNIVNMLENPYYIYNIENKTELIHTYQAIDYLQIDKLMNITAKNIANYMNNCKIKKLTSILKEFALL